MSQQYFGHPHPFQITGMHVGSQLPQPGQQARGANQHIQSPMQGGETWAAGHMAGAQVMPPGQQARGPLQHIQSPTHGGQVWAEPSGQFAGAQIMPPGQPARGVHQHIQSHTHGGEVWAEPSGQFAGAQIMPPGQPARGALQHIQSYTHGGEVWAEPSGQMTGGPFQQITGAKQGHPVQLEYPRGEWRYQISGNLPYTHYGTSSMMAGADATTPMAPVASSGSMLSNPTLTGAIGLALGVVLGVVLAPEISKVFK